MDPWTTSHAAVTAVQQYYQSREPTTKLRQISFVLLDFTTEHAFGTAFNEVVGSEESDPTTNDDADARQDADLPSKDQDQAKNDTWNVPSRECYLQLR